MQSNAMDVFGVVELLETILDRLTDHDLVHALTQNVLFRNSIITSPNLRPRLPILDSYERVPESEYRHSSRRYRQIEWWKVRQLGLYTIMARNPFIAKAVRPILSPTQRRELYLDQAPTPQDWSHMWLETSDEDLDHERKWYANPHLVNGASPDRRAIQPTGGNLPSFLFEIPQAPGIVYRMHWNSHCPKYGTKLAGLNASRDPSSMPFVHTIHLTRARGIERRSLLLQEFQLDMFLVDCKVPFMMRVCDKAGLDCDAFEAWFADGLNTSIFCPAGTQMRHLVAWTEAWAQGAEGDLLGVASNGISEVDESDWLLQDVAPYSRSSW